ncbi:hypothetical protein CIW48_20755 [Methylobacterium sp. P1-11]|uniref:CopD family protein n=1 Tax=Methylobacterium sp. P1-11 TaxID=2024616 RepID=UPI0011EF6822|nr:CopD family protein [Methylobacterium sp. P1-11]KAA0121974.1 hypothetical protein CIW48_20755 [Methylobacterium sp. P1-11]
MSVPDGYGLLKGAHVAAAMTFVGGLLATAVLLPASRRLPLAARPVSHLALRWSRRVTAPAMLLVWTFGLVLALEGRWFSDLWLQMKLAFVVLLSALHGVQSGALRRWAGGQQPAPMAATAGAAPLILACVTVVAFLAVTKLT